MTKTYTAKFRTDAEYAERRFKADTPGKALRLARKFLAARSDDLMFESYDSGMPVNEIAISDESDDELAVWYDDELRLRLTARDLLDAAELAVRELRQFHSDGESEALRVLSEAIAKATGEIATGSRTATRRQLPPDPERMNGDRAEWAVAALRHFQCTTGCDYARPKSQRPNRVNNDGSR